jgi:tetratricopeptide (TPR) repeat protein
VLLLGSLSVAAAAWLIAFLARHGFDWSAKFSEIASFVLAVLVVLLPAAGRLALWLPTPRLRSEQIAADVSDLAAALRAQGRTEAVLPGVSVYDRLPMRVRWESADAGSESERTGSFYDVIELFRELPEQRLVVLGEAGAGKSVLVTELARSLLAHRGSEDPVPVVFSMVGWNPELATLFDWMSGQLARVNPDLGQEVSDGGQIITRAQVLIDRLKVLPVLDGLDEVGRAALPAATLAVNRYGWAQPLVVTCRSEEYLEATGTGSGTPLARAAVIELIPLTRDDIEIYLGPDPEGRWTAVRDRLAAEPDGPLARALGNPLMLWLIWEVYRYGEPSPDELTDRYRFGRQLAVEARLLSEFVPAVYRAGRRHRSVPSWWQQPTAAQARRWLGFLASDYALRRYKHSTGRKRSRSRKSGRQPTDDVIETHNKSVAWWHFTAAASGFRFIGVAIRAIVLWIVLWRSITTILGYAGNWRHGTYVGHLAFRRIFLDGPLGQYVWPTIRQAIDVAPARTRRAAFTTLNDVLRRVAAIPSHHFFYLALVAIPVLAVYARAAEPIRPRRLRVRVGLPARCAIIIAENIVALAVAALIAMGYWGRADIIGDFFTTRRTWLSLLVLALGFTIYALPRRLVAEIDVVGATMPRQSLREDRLAAITTTVARRVLFTVTLALFCGPLVATTYALFAFVSTVTMLTLGGLTGFASSSYTDACHWLAMTGRLPWRPMPFLMDAERRGVFHEIGAIFQFRHIRVQLALEDWYRANQVQPEDVAPRLLGLLDEAGLYTSPSIRHLSVLKQRADGYRALATRNLPEFGSDLLSALNQQARILAQLRRREEVITVRGEITATARAMVASGYAAPLTLAESLEGLARCLAEAGRTFEGFGVMTGAADIYRQSPTTDRQPFEQRLADWIELFPFRIGTRKSTRDLDDAADALADVYRDLVLTEVGAVTPAYADSLIRLAGVSRRLHRPGDAASALKRAYETYRELIQANALEPAHARKLLDVAGLLAQTGLHDDAVAALTDAVSTYRTLAETALDQAAAHNTSLTQSLVQLANLLSRLDRPGELDAIRQAVGVYRAAADDDSRIARLACPPLADLQRLAIRLWKLGDTDEALAAAQTARRLADINVVSDDAALAEVDLPPDAMIRSLMLHADRYPNQMSVFAPGRLQAQADELDTLAFQLLAAGRVAESRTAQEAVVRASEAVVMMYRSLAADEPASSLPALAKALDKLAAYLTKMGSRETEAAVAAAEARDIRRRLGRQDGHEDRLL